MFLLGGDAASRPTAGTTGAGGATLVGGESDAVERQAAVTASAAASRQPVADRDRGIANTDAPPSLSRFDPTAARARSVAPERSEGRGARGMLTRVIRPEPRQALLALLVALAAAGADPSAAEDPPVTVFRVEVESDGVYAVRFEDLVAAGLASAPVASATLGLSGQGRPVPIWVDDGGDGAFGPGDRLELVGHHLAGESAWFNEYSTRNAYLLRTDDPGPARMRQEPAPSPPRAPQSVPPPALDLRIDRHLERDLLLLRFNGEGGAKQDLWYWAKLSHVDAEPFTMTLDLADLAADRRSPVALRLELRGWSRPASKPAADMPDHVVEVLLDGVAVGRGEWNGQEAFSLRLGDLAGPTLAPGSHVLSLRVPARGATPGQDPILDVVVLNWIEVEYPWDRQLRADQAEVSEVEDRDRGAPAALLTVRAGADRLVLYTDDGRRAEAGRSTRVDGWSSFSFADPGAGSFRLVADGRFRSPIAVEAVHPDRWSGRDHHADYLIFGPARLLPAIAPLAEYHRRGGLAVETIDIQDVYDQLNHGIVHPRALRDFVEHAFHDWRPPAPRFMLLVGDASWDPKNERTESARYPGMARAEWQGTGFAFVPGTPYSGPPETAHRDLVPTWSYSTYDGHAAGDNYFVSVDGEDELPDLAIGRLPVTEPAEVTAIVEKTLRYAAAPAGPWQRSVLFVTGDFEYLQASSDRLASRLAVAGLATPKIYPHPAPATGGDGQEALRHAFDEGQLIVHFLGHGGRYIWRTGPPDYAHNRDLFTLADVDALRENDRLPLVLAMTCYSAPFDHPTEDSIGEKLLRTPRRGAVAVIAASWRNDPSPAMSTALFDALQTAATVGEALQRAKRASADRDFVEQYNLLGDPALRLATPAASTDLPAPAAPRAADVGP